MITKNTGRVFDSLEALEAVIDASLEARLVDHSCHVCIESSPGLYSVRLVDTEGIVNSNYLELMRPRKLHLAQELCRNFDEEGS